MDWCEGMSVSLGRQWQMWGQGLGDAFGPGKNHIGRPTPMIRDAPRPSPAIRLILCTMAAALLQPTRSLEIAKCSRGRTESFELE